MLAVMATVTTGLLSPNSYGLTQDQAAKMAEFSSHVGDASTDSEPDERHLTAAPGSTPTTVVHAAANNKRNKRKNFEPRCTNVADMSEDECESMAAAAAAAVAPLSNNNNASTNNNNISVGGKSRRKTTARKLVYQRPMNLSGKPAASLVAAAAAAATATESDSPATMSSAEEDEDDAEDDDDSEGAAGGGGGATPIPTSFSIRNLSKSAAAGPELDFQQLAAAAAAASYHAQHALINAAAGGGGGGIDMRDYAMHTMRELLSIYGMTAEAADSFARHLPFAAAFTSGHPFEQPTAAASPTPPSQPPTPPSTPLSPKNNASSAAASAPTLSQHLTQLAQLANIPTASPQVLPQGATSDAATAATPKQQVKVAAKTAAVNGAPWLEYSYSQLEQLEALRNRALIEDNSAPPPPPPPPAALPQQKMMHAARGIFPHLLNFGNIKLENESPPPAGNVLDMSLNPLSAIMSFGVSTTTPPTSHHQATPGSISGKPRTQIDYSKYVKKFASSLECGGAHCRDLHYREHFHCLDCNSRVFLKKEEMIRHFKWHKKRDESLQHGFMRYSPLDDCTVDRYGMTSATISACTHNRKQTHYHCIQEGCDKVYISTSDVQMHANYHRKDSAIIQEGFQRFRATEECGAVYCAFFGQRTTHFHCRRTNCRYTFKNKSDMEKHKTYHVKDEQLTRDGFKKFMKNEACPYDSCRFSKVCNHIHCIRPQCNYVLHSSGQLFSHKRKHERQDSELAYRKYKLAQSMVKTMQEVGGTPDTPQQLQQQQQQFGDGLEALNLSALAMGMGMNMGMGSNTSESLSERNSPVSYEDNEDNTSLAMDLSAAEDATAWSSQEDDVWRKYCQVYGPSEECACAYAGAEHYHCNADCCEMTFSGRDGAREHARQHDQQEHVADVCYSATCEDTACMYYGKDKHYHCLWENCREVVMAESTSDKPFRRLEHYRMHEYSKKLSLTKDPLTMTHLATSIDGMFCRKRGRPPKNRVIEVWNEFHTGSGSGGVGGGMHLDSPQAIFTSFKLPKPSTSTPLLVAKEEQAEFDDSAAECSPKVQSPRPPSPRLAGPTLDFSSCGFDVVKENSKCSDVLCPYLGSMHFHCARNRCLYVTDKEDTLATHSQHFHEPQTDGLNATMEFFDSSMECHVGGCAHGKLRHFHCAHSNCLYVSLQYADLVSHVRSHSDMHGFEDGHAKERIGMDRAINLSNASDVVAVPAAKVSVVKASGTFYPLSSVPQSECKSPEAKSTTDLINNDISGSNTLYGPEHSCSRPFCKLKRKFHYHCNACNQAFSEIDRLVVHVAKHSTGALTSGTASQMQLLEDNNNHSPSPPAPLKGEGKIQVAALQTLQGPTTAKDDALFFQQQHQQQQFDAYSPFTSFPANLQFALMSQQQFLPQSYTALSPQMLFQHQSLMQTGLLQGQAYPDSMSPLAAMAANLNKRAMESSASSSHDLTPEVKKARMQNSMRILKDEPVPEGYLRFRFNEDCQYQHCGYREHQTHFHCQRQDCGYSFCDKTRFVQHTARHERLDTLMGGDFQQYRANVSCGRPDCAYTANLGATQNKASHFHCLKCDFVCTDTNKVVAHRRQHQKLDSIQAAGFEKFTPSQHCRSTTCQHSGKQTHYHCLQCQYAVLGLAQMSAHKYRHMEG